MASEIEFNIIPAGGAFLTIVVLMSPFRAVIQARSKGTLGKLNPLPFVCMLLNMTAWLAYGLHTSDWYIASCSLFGLAISAFYTATGLRLGSPRQFRQSECIGYCLASTLAAAIAVTSQVDYATGTLILGLEGSATAMIMNVSPLTSIREVLRTRSAVSIHLPLSLASTVNCVLCVIYGVAVENTFVLIPNLISTFFGLAQLFLKAIVSKYLSKHYRPVLGVIGPVTAEMAAAVAADASTPLSAPCPSKKEACPICLDPLNQSIKLSCSHVLCAPCASKCSFAGIQRCPVCRHPHLLDPKLLRERRAAWRADYGGWRMGNVKGAKGEFVSIASPSGESPKKRDGTSSSALIWALDLATDPAAVKRAEMRGIAKGGGVGKLEEKLWA